MPTIKQVKEEILREFEDNPSAWHIDSRQKWLASSLDRLLNAVKEASEGMAKKYDPEDTRMPDPFHIDGYNFHVSGLSKLLEEAKK